jgi:N-acetylglucosamine-6-phosphate deacetylase
MAKDGFTIANARLVGYSGLQQIEILNRTIARITPSGFTPADLDLHGDWLSLGGIDLQINGALGLAFPDLDAHNAEKLDAIASYLWQQGVDGYLPTLVTSSVESIQRSLSVLAAQPKIAGDRAQILGVHLEGPFLNPVKRGAHPKEHLLPLTLENVKRVLGDYSSCIKIITLAPELDETGTVIPYLRSLGIVVSLGHSLATAEQAQQAFAQGATMVTHAFNAMPPLHHRQPGLLAAAIVDRQVRCGLIADGEHVSPLMIDVLLKSADYEQGIFLVSDALSPLGLPDGVYPWDTRQITINQGTARLLDGTLSGTTLPLLVGAQNLVQWGLCSEAQAIAMATISPRLAIGLDAPYLGQPARLLRWHREQSGSFVGQRLQIADSADATKSEILHFAE